MFQIVRQQGCGKNILSKFLFQENEANTKSPHRIRRVAFFACTLLTRETMGDAEQ
jgi:hypothetical protein